MIGDILVKLMVWFVLGQLEQFSDKIDWKTVADDFMEILKKIFPKRFSTDLVQLQCRQHIMGMGQRFAERRVWDHYGKQSWDGACKDWLDHGSKDVASDSISIAILAGIADTAPVPPPTSTKEPQTEGADLFEDQEIMADGYAVAEKPRHGRRHKG